MAGVEDRPSRERLDAARESFLNAIHNYYELVGEVGVIQACMLGGKPGLRTSYIWNVLTEDYTPGQMQEDPHFARLSEGAATTIAQSYRHIPLRIANVIPSRAAELKRRYEQNGLNLSVEPLTGSGVTFPLAPLTQEGRQTSLDILIGGLMPADATLQAAQEIAAKASENFGEDRADVEKTFGFELLDRLKDPRAASVLKDIAFARNAQFPEGFARGLELLAEPSRVLEEIMIDIFDGESMKGITELDIRAAIESGALKCKFGKR